MKRGIIKVTFIHLIHLFIPSFAHSFDHSFVPSFIYSPFPHSFIPHFLIHLFVHSFIYPIIISLTDVSNNYQNEPVFGSTLVLLAKAENTDVPLFVRKCIQVCLLMMARPMQFTGLAIQKL